MNAKKQTEGPYVQPAVTTYFTAEILAKLGPAHAIYGSLPFP